MLIYFYYDFEYSIQNREKVQKNLKKKKKEHDRAVQIFGDGNLLKIDKVCVC
jgi:hypothetical protein